MLVLVTGGTGFVGSHIVSALVTKGHQARLLVRNREKAECFFRNKNISLESIVVGSITDEHLVKSVLSGCDGVVHTAAITPMQSASEAELFATNVQGVKNVIGGAIDQGINNVVFVSSITAIFNTDGSKLDADAPIAASSHPYGKSKAQAEEYVRGLQSENKPVKTVYPGGIVGPDDPGLSATLMSLQYRMTHGFKLTSGGTQQIDVRDLAAIIVTLLEKNDAKPERLITAGNFMLWEDFAALLEKISGTTLEKKQIPGWFLRLVGRVYDCKRLFKPVALPVSAETMKYATQWPHIENAPSLAALGVKMTTAEQTFTDTLQWMLKTGLLDKRHVPALAGKF